MLCPLAVISGALVTSRSASLPKDESDGMDCDREDHPSLKKCWRY